VWENSLKAFNQLLTRDPLTVIIVILIISAMFLAGYIAQMMITKKTTCAHEINPHLEKFQEQLAGLSELKQVLPMIVELLENVIKTQSAKDTLSVETYNAIVLMAPESNRSGRAHEEYG
jgi:flagellar biosynthesis protein FlhB